MLNPSLSRAGLAEERRIRIGCFGQLAILNVLTVLTNGLA